MTKSEEIRSILGISRAAFSRKYNIPIRTLEDWDAGKKNPPEYVMDLLERVVNEDKNKEGEDMNELTMDRIRITKEELDKITNILVDGLYTNEDIMIPLYTEFPPVIYKDKYYYVSDIIATLHNLLYECVTGKKYDYMWHWANKCGMWANDNIFEEEKSNE